LCRCLHSVFGQNAAPAQVIVVDNGSTDDTLSKVRELFPQVRLISNEENLGIRARNIGYRAAETRIILSLDDDIELIDPSTLDRVQEHFRSTPRLGALTLKLCEEHSGPEFAASHWWHPRPRERFQDREFETDRINEAAVAFLAEALERVGYYYEELFWGAEEMDLSLGIMDAGFTLRYAPVPVLHLAPRGNLNYKADYRHALLVRNRCWIAFRRLPLASAVVFIAPRMALWLVRSIRYGYFRYYLRGILDLMLRLPLILRERATISAETQARLKHIRQVRS
jgi:GT2 family glycosyltransferase